MFRETLKQNCASQFEAFREICYSIVSRHLKETLRKAKKLDDWLTDISFAAWKSAFCFFDIISKEYRIEQQRAMKNGFFMTIVDLCGA